MAARSFCRLPTRRADTVPTPSRRFGSSIWQSFGSSPKDELVLSRWQSRRDRPLRWKGHPDEIGEGETSPSVARASPLLVPDPPRAGARRFPDRRGVGTPGGGGPCCAGAELSRAANSVCAPDGAEGKRRCVTKRAVPAE